MKRFLFALCLALSVSVLGYAREASPPSDTIIGVQIYQSNYYAAEVIYLGQEMYIRHRASRRVMRGFLTAANDSTFTIYHRRAYYTFRYEDIARMGKFNNRTLLRNVLGYPMMIAGAIFMLFIPLLIIRVGDIDWSNGLAGSIGVLIITIAFFFGLALFLGGLALLRIKRTPYHRENGWQMKPLKGEALKRIPPPSHWQEIVGKVLLYAFFPLLGLHELFLWLRRRAMKRHNHRAAQKR